MLYAFCRCSEISRLRTKTGLIEGSCKKWERDYHLEFVNKKKIDFLQWDLLVVETHVVLLKSNWRERQRDFKLWSK